MNDNSNWEGALDRKVRTAKNLVWIASGIFAFTVAAAGYAAKQVQEITSEYVRYDDELRVYVEDVDGTEFDFNVRTDVEDGNVLKVDAGPDLYLPYFRIRSEDAREVSFRLEKKRDN